VGFNLTIPLGNKFAQSQQARSLMEYRQAELRLEQLYTQIRMQVVNAACSRSVNDRAQVQAAIAALRLTTNRASIAEHTKLQATALPPRPLVMLQQRSLATAEDNLIAANAAIC
jgi:outer membrane protein